MLQNDLGNIILLLEAPNVTCKEKVQHAAVSIQRLYLLADRLNTLRIHLSEEITCSRSELTLNGGTASVRREVSSGSIICWLEVCFVSRL
ncbi:hypothetical protein EVAR_4690_1 [Eumeta japonica]|uniref:Uncharacterized protein n=1 Tax=Eumeta variegata TaxID=151549 RepID=A0A4C1WQN3_EUMVA|nr:hypothetical protein EVAR_4690_1 [Eumeta japonica]